MTVAEAGEENQKMTVTNVHKVQPTSERASANFELLTQLLQFAQTWKKNAGTFERRQIFVLHLIISMATAGNCNDNCNNVTSQTCKLKVAVVSDKGSKDTFSRWKNRIVRTCAGLSNSHIQHGLSVQAVIHTVNLFIWTQISLASTLQDKD